MRSAFKVLGSVPLVILVIIIGTFFIISATTSQASSQSSNAAQRETFFISDSLEGCGESVLLTGNINQVIQVVPRGDESGIFHAVAHTNFQDVTGVGLATGDEYEIRGSQNLITNIQPSGAGGVDNAVGTMNIVSKGSGENFVGHFIFRFTVNANGEITSELMDVVAECRG
jgi:hypothetical protein